MNVVHDSQSKKGPSQSEPKVVKEAVEPSKPSPEKAGADEPVAATKEDLDQPMKDEA